MFCRKGKNEMIYLYRFLHIILLPVVAAFFVFRIFSGKEDKQRLKERFGKASLKRDFSKKLVWIHCASVGESLSVLPMVTQILERNHNSQILLTTGSVTSAALMAKKLPKGAFHQYIPIDYYFCVRRFMNYWKPDLSIFTESELWINLVDRAPNKILINARMSDKSFKRYKKIKSFSNAILDKFECIFTQSDQDFERFSALTNAKVVNSGNLKYDGAAPDFNKNDLKVLKEVLADKKVLVAASTHPKEEEIILNLYKDIKKEVEDLFLIFGPRHPHRGAEIVKIIKDSKLTYRQRSDNKNVESISKLDVYLADTLGEMGLWYNIADVVLMGGTLTGDHGGHNVLEPLKCGKPTITGPSMYNFKNMTDILLEKEVLTVCKDEKELQDELIKSLKEKDKGFDKKAKAAIESLTGATETILKYIESHIQK